MTTIYVVVTEDWYGGGKLIHTFDDLQLAHVYAKVVGNKYNLDTGVYKTLINNTGRAEYIQTWTDILSNKSADLLIDDDTD
jgi:hypothetical protein